MKISRIIVCLVFLCLSSTAEAQILSRIFKFASKSATKETAAKGVKDISEEIATRAVVKELGQSAGKRYTSTLLKETSQEVNERIVKKPLSKGVNEIIQVGLKRNTDNIIIDASKNISRKALSESTEHLTQKEIISIVNRNAQSAFKDVAQKRVIVSVVETGLERQLKELLGERAAKIWLEIVAKEGAERKTKLLLADIATNKKLRDAIKSNPNLVKAYHNAIDAPGIRSDLSMLRYIDNGAGRISYNGYFTKYGDGSNLIFKENNGVCKIYHNRTGTFLGTLEYDEMGKKIIRVPEGGDRTLLNLSPLSDCTYISGNNTWITNKTGQVIEARCKVRPTKNPVRDKYADKYAKEYKRQFSTDGNRIKGSLPQSKVNENSGHLIALENGGTNDLINYIPQNATNNKGGLWRSSEKAANKAAENGMDVQYIVRCQYDSKTSLRPISLTREQTVNGKHQKIKDQIMDGKFVIDNRLELAS